jgi:hypothetical protein
MKPPSLKHTAQTLLMALAALSLTSCGAREFRTEGEAIAHFKEHRQSFDRAAALFLSLNTATIKIPESPAAGTETPLVQLARELRVSDISAVAAAAPPKEQWVEFRLAQRLLTSTYGLIFVPEGHDLALNIARAQVDSPPHGVRFIHSIEGRWFYFDYD